MESNAFLNRKIVMKDGKHAVILKAEPYESEPNELLFTIKEDANKKTRLFLALKGFMSESYRFEDESLNQSFLSLADDQKKEKERQAEEERKRQLEEEKKRLELQKRMEESRRIICIRKTQKTHNPSNVHCYQADITSSSSCQTFREMSPFLVGPGQTDKGETYKRFENFYQFSKVYQSYADEKGNPTDLYFQWRKEGFDRDKASRHPVRGSKVLYSLYYEKTPDGDVRSCRLGYVESRKKLYIPHYAKLVVKTEGFKQLKEKYDSGERIALIDYDAYDEFDMVKVVNNPNKIMGHCFVIKMLLQRDIEVRGDEVIDHIGVLE